MQIPGISSSLAAARLKTIRPGIHDRSGRTVSLGDTIDSMALIYGKE